MANIRQKTAYLCSACGDDFPKWNGQCPSCKEWGTLSEFKTSRKKNNNRIDLKDSRSLNDPRTDMMKVAAAGPLANFILAFSGGMILRLLSGTNLLTETMLVMLLYFIQINIALAVFNLIPIAPLDGSQIFSGYLARTNPGLAWKIQTYGPQVLFGLILLGYLTNFSIIWMIMRPFVNFFMLLFAGISI